MNFLASEPLGRDLRAAVDAAVAAAVAHYSRELVAIAPELATAASLASAFTGGGKRLRPAFCYWGYRCVATPSDALEPALVDAAASLDVLHVSALVHDDVMDASDTRRGLPAAHRQFEAQHADLGLRGSAEAYGRAGAILLGDLLVMWSVQMLAESGLPADAMTRGLPFVHAMRSEVTAGQFLDVMAQGHPLTSPDRLTTLVERVVEFKTAKYTVQRPVQFGAALAGASASQLAALGEYGSALGRAFQYRDDVLGIFGDAAVTGKPAGDDLREGKLTALVSSVLEAGGPSADRLGALLGRADLDSDDVDESRTIVRESGALAAVEEAIESGRTRALAALHTADFTDDGRQALTLLADAATRRSA
ncbi:MAG: polyprenyl synthetase family protein [Propionibacteriaceae bacterium]|nr:polyprenyl synthetase family protein [Micropruina sp.]HBX80303.1 polyprenyl synthetase family protein [Propionibacteriaceae bacterium]HBY22512.1 polyprenyl synthetase family protein [Propionibacteriaceae bacterium]